MYDAELVAEIVATMRKAVTIPITVKCRLGVDDHDKWDHIVHFIKTVSEKGGCTKFIIHARKCFLKGLNPKENRTIPQLKYDWVFNLKKLFPHLNFVINGGFSNVNKVKEIMSEDNPLNVHNGLEGCMSGRLAMNTTWECARIDREIFDDYSYEGMSREEICLNYADFAQAEQDKAWNKGIKLSSNILVKPLVYLFQEEYQGGKWRKLVTGIASVKDNKGKIKKVILEIIDQYK